MAEKVSRHQADLLSMQDGLHVASVKARTIAIDRLCRLIEVGTNWIDGDIDPEQRPLNVDELCSLTNALERILPD